jgi:nicotinamide-nucleotide amidase
MIDSSLAHSVLLTMGRKGLSLGSVESLTGGLFASSICSIPGASKVFKGAVVSYSNDVKEKLVGVNPATIDQ